MKWLVIAVLVLVQQPAKTPEGPRAAKSNNTKNTAHAEQRSTDPKQTTQSPPDTAPGNLRAVPEGHPSIDSSTATNKLQGSSDDQAIQWKLVWFSGALVVVGVLQSLLMFLTWRVYRRQAFIMEHQIGEMTRQRVTMRGQLEAMEGQLAQMVSAGQQTDRLIEQATKQTTATEGQVELMKSAGLHTETLAAQAVKQSSITQRQLDLTNRPWICLDSVVQASDFVFKDSGEVVVFFKYQIRNVGHSVAQHLQPWIEPIVSGVHNPVEVKDRISAQLKKPIDSAFDHGKLIFPSQIIVDTYPVLIRKEVVDEAIKNSPFKGEGDKQLPCFGLELFICFDYQSTLDPTMHHQTQSMYILGHADPRGVVIGAFYPSQRIYKVAEITVGYKGYGAYAD